MVTEKGGAHLGAYFSALRDSPECDGVVLCDPGKTNAEEARRVLGEKLTAVFEDTDQMLMKAKPVMALVSMEAVNAPTQIDKLLDGNVHVFAEKPACTQIEEFASLVKKADAAKLNLMLAFANRLTPAVQKAKSLINDGLLGDLYGAEVHMVADQTRLKNQSYHTRWYADRARAGGGILTWLGIHWLDLTMLLTGLKISEVAGFSGIVGGQPLKIEDSVSMAMRFENGANGTMNAGYYTDRGYHSYIKLWGSKGWIEYREHLGGRTELPLTWYSNENAKDGIIEYSGPMEPKGYTPFVQRCLQACAGSKPPPVTGAEGLQVLKTVFALYKAAESRATISVDQI